MVSLLRIGRIRFRQCQTQDFYHFMCHLKPVNLGFDDAQASLGLWSRVNGEILTKQSSCCPAKTWCAKDNQTQSSKSRWGSARRRTHRVCCQRCTPYPQYNTEQELQFQPLIGSLCARKPICSGQGEAHPGIICLHHLVQVHNKIWSIRSWKIGQESSMHCRNELNLVRNERKLGGDLKRI